MIRKGGNLLLGDVGFTFMQSIRLVLAGYRVR